MRALLRATLLLVLAMPSAAQSRATLTLDEALEIAKKNNPNFLQTVTGRQRAAAAVRSAYGQLIPTADVGLGASYREGRPQFFGGVAFGATSDIISSNWNLSSNLRLSYATLTTIRRANASLDAADADIETALYVLRSGVTAQFILALQTQARASLQDTLVVQQRLQLELAQARAGVGSGTSLDVKRAEVGLGTQQVAALRARNAAQVARLQLFGQLGVPMSSDVVLTADLPVTAPTMTVADLLTMARQVNPALRSLLARERVANQGVQAARGEYLPSLGLSASVGGVAQKQQDISPALLQAQAQADARRASCLTTDSLRTGAGMPTILAQCNAIQFTPADAQAIRAANDNFPFGFERNPYNLSLSISLPLFDGFVREQRVAEANASQTDARYSVRRQELAITADVTSARVTLQAAFEAAELQARNAATAREALQLAEERYRVGSNTFVDLTTARGEYERAETDRIDAIYEFHRAYATLEAAVGRTLR